MSRFVQFISTRRGFIKGYVSGITSYAIYQYIQGSIDRDSNGVSRNELIQKVEDKSKQYDTDHNGILTAGEIVDGLISDTMEMKHKIEDRMTSIDIRESKGSGNGSDGQKVDI